MCATARRTSTSGDQRVAGSAAAMSSTSSSFICRVRRNSPSASTASRTAHPLIRLERDPATRGCVTTDTHTFWRRRWKLRVRLPVSAPTCADVESAGNDRIAVPHESNTRSLLPQERKCWDLEHQNHDIAGTLSYVWHAERYLEGGREAFQRRSQKYGLSVVTHFALMVRSNRNQWDASCAMLSKRSANCSGRANETKTKCRHRRGASATLITRSGMRLAVAAMLRFLRHDGVQSGARPAPARIRMWRPAAGERHFAAVLSARAFDLLPRDYDEPIRRTLATSKRPIARGARGATARRHGLYRVNMIPRAVPRACEGHDAHWNIARSPRGDTTPGDGAIDRVHRIVAAEPLSYACDYRECPKLHNRDDSDFRSRARRMPCRRSDGDRIHIIAVRAQDLTVTLDIDASPGSACGPASSRTKYLKECRRNLRPSRGRFGSSIHRAKTRDAKLLLPSATKASGRAR